MVVIFNVPGIKRIDPDQFDTDAFQGKPFFDLAGIPDLVQNDIDPEILTFDRIEAIYLFKVGISRWTYDKN